MSDLKADILKNFGQKLRIRVCGLYLQDGKLLLLKHRSIGKEDVLWSPPGGGMHFGESAGQALVREFMEETGLTPCSYEFAFVHEYLNPPLHAIELFFFIHEVKGKAQLGTDPEMPREQLLQELAFLDLENLHQIPDPQKHFLLRGLHSWKELGGRGSYTFFDGQC